MSTEQELGHLLDSQRAYYQAMAPDYLTQNIDISGGDELHQAVAAFQPAGSVLELACGPGTWTSHLARYAADVTAVDGSAAMPAVAAARTASDRVRFIQADLFSWQPDRQYDAVFMGFWISHVPPERFASFWQLVADALKPGGQAFFCDDAFRTADELIEGPESSTIRRRTPDGSGYRIVKVPHQAAGLEGQLRQLGWQADVHQTSGPIYWGTATRR